jgi:hypothetical protein
MNLLGRTLGELNINDLRMRVMFRPGPNLPLRRTHLQIYEEDWEFLERHYGDKAAPSRRIGAGPAARAILHKHILEMRADQLMELDRQTANWDFEEDDDGDF